MTDLSTYQAQTSHYAAVKARLGVPAVKRRRVAAIPAPEPEPPRPLSIVLSCEEVKPLPVIGDKMPPWKAILLQVSASHGIPPEQIVSPIRTTRVVLARQEYCYRLREEVCLTWHQIGRRVGRDHTSCMHSWRRHARFLETGSYVSHEYRQFWTPEKIAEAMDLHSRGLTYEQVAKRVGASTALAVASKLQKHRRALAETKEIAARKAKWSGQSKRLAS
jgi:hypothetical protein